jgi:hypothetical protein
LEINHWNKNFETAILLWAHFVHLVYRTHAHRTGWIRRDSVYFYVVCRYSCFQILVGHYGSHETQEVVQVVFVRLASLLGLSNSVSSLPIGSYPLAVRFSELHCDFVDSHAVWRRNWTDDYGRYCKLWLTAVLLFIKETFFCWYIFMVMYTGLFRETFKKIAVYKLRNRYQILLHWNTDNLTNIFLYIFHRCSMCPPLFIRQTSIR